MFSCCEKIDLGNGYSQKIYSNGAETWHLNGKLHREDGPSIKTSNGTKSWYLNGKLHRKDGPAVEWSFGTKEWWYNGECHREDGPAVEYLSGEEGWWFNGIECKKEVIDFVIERKRKLALKYWLSWTDYVMNPYTDQGKRYINRQFEKLKSY